MIATVLLCLLGAREACASLRDPCDGEPTADDSDVSWTLVASKPAGWWDRPCPDEECRATRDLVCATYALNHTYHGNYMGYVKPNDGQRAQARAYRHLLRFLHDHPRRNPIYCELLARVAPRIGLLQAQGRWDWNADYLLKFALLFDRPGNHCLAKVRAAAPDTPDARTAIAGYGIVCSKSIAECRAALIQSFRKSERELLDQAKQAP